MPYDTTGTAVGDMMFVGEGRLRYAAVEGRPAGQTGPPSFDRLRKDEKTPFSLRC